MDEKTECGLEKTSLLLTRIEKERENQSHSPKESCTFLLFGVSITFISVLGKTSRWD